MNKQDQGSSELKLPASPKMQDFQRFIYALEHHHGWLDVDLIHNCFLMGEEVGELFKAIRRYEKYYEQNGVETATIAERKSAVAEELVDVFNYLLALANRLDIDFETAFREKNARNIKRRWDT